MMRDPNTGDILRDRFHQVRGAVAEGMVTDNTVKSLATQLLQSRGAPMTAQNMQMAMDYLRGGDMQRFEQQQSTEAAIADAAMNGTQPQYGGGGGGGGGAAAPAQPAAAPSMPVDAPLSMPPGVPPMDITGEGDGGLSLPGMVAGAGAAAAAGAGAAAALRMLNGKPLQPDAQGRVMLPAERGRSTALSAQEAADAGWAVVGLNYPQGGIEGPNAAPALPAPDYDIEGTATDVTDQRAVTQQPAPPPAQDAQPTPAPSRRDGRKPAQLPASTPDTPSAGPATAPAGPAAAPDPASAPISTDEVMGNRTSSEAIATQEVGPSGERIFRDTLNGGYIAKDAQGKWQRGATMDELHRALRGAIRAIR